MRYLTNPTVISLDRNYHEWNATFPSLTVCFHDRLNLTARDALTNRVNPKDPAKFKRFLATLAEAHLFRLEQLIEFDEYSDLDLKSVLNQISNVVDAEVVLENGLKAKLHRVITDLGICYTFNSAILQFLSVEPLSDEDLRSGLVEISIIERDTAATLSNLSSNGDVGLNLSTAHSIKFLLNCRSTTTVRLRHPQSLKSFSSKLQCHRS